MAKALTIKSIENVKPDPAKRLEIPDGLLRGLYLVVQPSGAKSWAARYRAPETGKPAKLTIGRFPAIGLADARKAAGEALRAVSEGEDPAALKVVTKAKAADRSDTVAALLDEFLKRHVKANNKATTAREHERLIERDLKPAWGARKVEKITRRDVIALLDAVKDRGAEITANRVLALVRVWFNWMISRGIVNSSPVAGVKAPTAERSRDRILTDREIILFWQGTDKLGFPFGAMARLLLLTGQRREEVAGMRWSELDLDGEPHWTLERVRTKNGKPHVVPLSPLAVEILRALPRMHGCDYVFSTNGKTHVSGYSRAKSILDRQIAALAEAEIPEWRFHDLRRTAASVMARLSIPVHVVEAILNHQTGKISGVAAIYNRYEYADEKRHGLETLAKFILDLVSEQPANVVPLRAG